MHALHLGVHVLDLALQIINHPLLGLKYPSLVQQHLVLLQTMPQFLVQLFEALSQRSVLPLQKFICHMFTVQLETEHLLELFGQLFVPPVQSLQIGIVEVQDVGDWRVLFEEAQFLGLRFEGQLEGTNFDVFGGQQGSEVVFLGRELNFEVKAFAGFGV